MKKLLLVSAAAARNQLRWAMQHLYTLLILSPLVLGISYATLTRLAEEAPAWHIPSWLGLALALMMEAALIGLSLTRAIVEVYHLRTSESFLDALPLPPDTHLHLALVHRLARTAAVGFVIVIVRALFGGGAWLDVSALAQLALFVIITALAETLAALDWIHWGHVGERPAALRAVLTLIVSIALGGLLLWFMIGADASRVASERWLMLACCIWAVALYLIARASHNRWRARDMEFAKRLQTSSRRRSIFETQALARRFERVVAAALARDLQLTLRGFSSAVYVVLCLAVLVFIALFTLFATGALPRASADVGWFAATWLPPVMAAKIACVLMVTAVSSLTPVLVAYQTPHVWLERAAGTSGKQLLEAKLWYARVVSAVSPLAVWLVAMLWGAVPLFYALPLLAECFWLWWLTSTLIGVLSYEMPDRPELALVLMISFGAAVGLFISVLWPVGVVLYALNGVRGLIDRGRARAGFFLLTEGD